jgi:UPF0176 protein
VQHKSAFKYFIKRVHTTPDNDYMSPNQSLLGSLMAKFLVSAFYKFVTLKDFAQLQEPLLEVCKTNEVMGTILLAKEGINGTIAGPENGVKAVLKFLRSDKRLSDLVDKQSWADKAPFYRMKVRLKREIVTLGVPELNPSENAGTYVKPTEWNELIASDDVVVVDTRNDYEVEIGTFKGALDPKTISFREFPAWVEDHLKGRNETKIAMFCTGGIRCEKSTAYMKSLGYENVYHLEGGILKYLEEVPSNESLWQGECFVFDQRVSVGQGLKPGSYDLCHACRHPITDEDKQSDRFVMGVSCPRCHDEHSAAQKKRFADRQRQIELAKQRNEQHIAVDIKKAKKAKEQKRKNARQM